MLVDGVKFSCKPCLLGHRSANCGHGDRHLFEVKKKGRPSTQCDECKAKRERTGGHIRCVCPRPEERPPLELPNGIAGAAVVDLPAPLVRNTSTSSATSSASSRAASVPAETLDTQATIGRKKSVSKSKRKDSNAASKPHDLAHGAAHLPSHVYSPYHTPIPHCRSAPMSKAPSVASCDLSYPPLELPPLPPLPIDLEAPAPSPALYELPAELELGSSASVDIDAFIASLDPNYWPAVPLEDVEGLASKADVEWPVGVGAGEAWPVATSSIGSAGGSEVNYSNTPGFGLGEWPTITDSTTDSFDLSSEIDKWRQVLVDESSGQQLPPLPNSNSEWIAPHFTDEPDYSAPSSAAFIPEIPFPTSAAFELPRPYLYDEGFFSSSSASSKAASSVAGSEYSAPIRKASQLSLSLVDFDLSLETSGAGGAYALQTGDDGYWDGKVDSLLFIPGGAEEMKVVQDTVQIEEVAC